VDDGRFHFQLIARNDGSAESGFVYTREIEELFFAVRNLVEDQDAGSLGHGFENQHAGHDGLSRKMALKEIFVYGDVFDCDNALLAFHFLDGVDEEERISVRENFLDPVDVENHY
jgi:hypothetical protein